MRTRKLALVLLSLGFVGLMVYVGVQRQRGDAFDAAYATWLTQLEQGLDKVGNDRSAAPDYFGQFPSYLQQLDALPSPNAPFRHSLVYDSRLVIQSFIDDFKKDPLSVTSDEKLNLLAQTLGQLRERLNWGMTRSEHELSQR